MLSEIQGTDIYLLDMLMRGRITPGMRILDAGCGGGRNIRYLINQGFDISAVDINPQAIDTIRQQAPHLPKDNFRIEPIGAISFPDASFDCIICNTVLHFAKDDEEFERMLKDLFRLLKPGGIFFSRLATSIGIEHQIEPINGRFARTLDGGERYLADAELLHHIEDRQNLTPLDPLKTTIVENQRAMTTWVVTKL
jgi:tellurite methyltransferase